MAFLRDSFFNAVKIQGIAFKTDVPMCEHTSFKIGGRAHAALFPDSSEQLALSIQIAHRENVPYYVVGRGTNLLVSDEGFCGVIIFTSEMNEIVFDGESVYADAGVNLAYLSNTAAERGLSGLEFACGIPGTLGGAIYMNAGAYGGEMKDITDFSDWYSPTLGFGRCMGAEQELGYRTSVYVTSDKIVLGAKMSLVYGAAEEIKEKCRTLLRERREKQPLEYPSAGSAFKRYPDRYTAKLIDEAGLKGFRVGGAAVSEKHAGFIVNLGGASSGDVIELVRLVRERIFEKEGIIIESEIKYLSKSGEERL